MKEKITNNLLLKILSLIIAFLVWLIVVNADNPIMTESFVVSDVQLLNEAYIDADGKMCMQDEEQDPIRVTIRAERKVLDRISASDIRAVADLQQAVSLDTDPVMVPITAVCAGIAPEDIVCVSVMPCTAKKFELQRDDQYAAGVPDVDISITTRELARLIRRVGIDFRSLPDEIQRS